jgi:secreted PhoX family phosphatase
MTDRLKNKISRRSLLKGAATVAGMAVVVPAALTSRPAEAAKAPKAAMQYRDTPNGKKECSNCLQFIPGKTPTAMGTCKVVAGDISPHGYCLAWAPKS